MSDYCKHGNYVGGCGIDWMCHLCEMGDEPPSVNEQKAHMRKIYQNMCVFLREYGLNFNHNPVWIHREIMASYGKELRRENQLLQNIKEYSRFDDDTDWLERRWREMDPELQDYLNT